MGKEKKEIGKLLELLNEYEGQDTWSYDEEMGMPYYGWGDDCDYEAYLISKKYGFIKWLVDNDKIDKKKLDEAERKPMYVTDDMFSLYKIDECVIMLLSISDTPIEDLILYLK